MKLYLNKGIFSLYDLQGMQDYINNHKKDCFVVTISPVKSKRSNDQNDLLHKICREFVLLANERNIKFPKFDDNRYLDLSHWRMEHFKSFFKTLYLNIPCPKTGITMAKDTSMLTMDQFRLFVDKVVDDFLYNGGQMKKKESVLWMSSKGIK